MFYNDMPITLSLMIIMDIESITDIEYNEM